MKLEQQVKLKTKQDVKGFVEGVLKYSSINSNGISVWIEQVENSYRVYSLVDCQKGHNVNVVVTKFNFFDNNAVPTLVDLTESYVRENFTQYTKEIFGVNKNDVSDIYLRLTRLAKMNEELQEAINKTMQEYALASCPFYVGQKGRLNRNQDIPINSYYKRKADKNSPCVVESIDYYHARGWEAVLYIAPNDKSTITEGIRHSITKEGFFTPDQPIDLS